MTNFVRRPRGRNNPRHVGRRNGSNFRANNSNQVVSINDNGNINGSFHRQKNNNNRHGGNAFKLVEKYKTLAQDALASGDRILAENYFQHADHFIRLLPEQKSPIVNEKIEPTISQEEKVEDEGKEKNLKISSNSESLEANEKNKKPIQA